MPRWLRQADTVELVLVLRRVQREASRVRQAVRTLRYATEAQPN